VTLHYIHDKEVPNGNTIVSDNLNTKETYSFYLYNLFVPNVLDCV